MILAYHQDLKYREIADILKIPVGTVKVLGSTPRLPSSRKWRDPPIGTGKNDAMNPDLKIDYVLGRLEGPDRDRIKEVLNNDPEAAAQVERLGRAVSLLLTTAATPAIRRRAWLAELSPGLPRFDHGPGPFSTLPP